MPLHPGLKGLRGKTRQPAVGRDPRSRLEDACGSTHRCQSVDDPWRAGGYCRPPVNVAKQVRAQRSGSMLEMVREELGLVRGHIDADGTLGLARLARETEIEGVFDLV